MTATKTLLTHDKIVQALEEIGSIVGQTLQRSMTIRIYGGGALILASNFRSSTSDIDYVGNKLRPQVKILRDTGRDNPENDFLFAAGEILRKKYKYRSGWFNHEVLGTLSPTFDHHELLHHENIGSFPSQGLGLDVYVPALDYILAMKLHALRIKKEENYKDLKDLLCLIRIKGDEIKNPADLVKIHARFYLPRQRRMDFEARIEQLWHYHTTGDIPMFVRRSGVPAAPRYLGYGRT